MFDIHNLAISAIEAGLNIVFTGESNSGKLTLARSVANDAPLLHSFELTSERLEEIRSLLLENRFVILKGVDQRSYQFIKPIVETKSVLGSKIETQFIITTSEEIGFKNTLTFKTAPHSKDGWLSWAKFSGVTESIVDLIESEEGFFEQYDIYKLSLIDKIIKSNSKNSEMLLDIIINNEQLTTLFVQNNNRSDNYDDGANLIKLLKSTDPKELLDLIKNNEDPAKLLASVVMNPKAMGLIDLATKDKEIQQAIDNALVKLL